MLALPALLSCGLLRHCARFFSLPPGYYGVGHIFMILAFMALCRIKSIEALGSSAPGEWGKLLGLDRCPATTPLRKKIKLLAVDGADEWAAQLCEDWMQADPANAGILYIDGHTRVYHGSQTKLPRHHVARQRLCMGATADYWVNGFDGLPFFKVNCAVDPGMINVLEHEIVPTLEQQVPDQPTEADLAADVFRMRFRLVFDHEGDSPGLFKRMNAKRKENPRHIEIKQLPEEDRFQKLAHRSKHFIDTLKIVAYRAETAMSNAVREPLGEHHQDEARTYVRKLYTTEANQRPDPSDGTLGVEIHSMATSKDNRILKELCGQLNETRTCYPGTNLRMVYKTVSD